ncbi:MAG: hypothetical protein HN337_08545 [Deltaproteobacteria bacterium]|jgi:hypothetical protein|nr:hypothetical protein [Deltaproteobacteria bacterium]
MGSIPTIRAMFSGITLATASSASQFIGELNSTSALTGALELFSHGIGFHAPPALADRFHSNYRTFQEATASGDHTAALTVARTQLSSIISGIPPDRWPSVSGGMRALADRTFAFSDVSRAVEIGREFLRGQISGWRPEIIVKAEDPRVREVVRTTIRKSMADLLAISVTGIREIPEALWVTKALDSGILSSPKVVVHVSELPKDKDVVLSVKSTRSSDGTPLINLGFRDQDILTGWLPSFAILQSTRLGQWVNVRDKHLLRQGRLISKPSHDYFQATVDPLTRTSSAPYLNHAMLIQAKLLTGNSHEELKAAIGTLQLKPDTLDTVMALLNKIHLNLTLTPVFPGDKGVPRLCLKYMKPPKTEAGSTIEELPRLLLAFSLPEGFLTELSYQDLMMLTGRGFVMWALEGEPAHDFQVKLDITTTGITAPVHQLGFRSGGPTLLIPDRIPAKWSKEFSSILHFVDHLRGFRIGRISHDFPILNDLIAIGNVRQAIGMDSIDGFDPLSRVEIKHSRSRSSIIITRSPTQEEPGYDMRIVSNLDELGEDLTPMEMVELILRIRHSAVYSKGHRGGVKIEDAKLHGMAAPGLIDALAWIKILWRYHNLQSETQDDNGTLNLLGEGAQQIADKLSMAFERLMATEYDDVEASILKHNKWVIEITKSGSEKTSEQPKADRVTVLTTADAKLIHFNGTPNLGTPHWSKLLRAILAAPEGTTIINMRGAWNSNRPELVISAGEERWYKLNPMYERASTVEQSKYRKALKTIKDIVRIYSSVIGMPPPEPTWSKTEIKELEFILLKLFHTDRKLHDGFIKIDDLVGVIEALGVLKAFHQS